MDQAGIFALLDHVAYWGRLFFLWAIPVLLLWKWFASQRTDRVWTGALIAVNIVLLVSALCALVVILLPIILGLASGEEYEQYKVLERMTGPYAWAFWIMTAALLLPFLLLDPGIRRSWRTPFLICLFFAVLPFLLEVATWVFQDTVPAAWSVFPTVAQITLIWVLLSVPVAATLRTRERRLLERGE